MSQSAIICRSPGYATDWSDTSISWIAGNDFSEPFNPEKKKKNIFALTHVSGYKYGTNFFNVDFLQSDSKKPASLAQAAGAQEACLVVGAPNGKSRFKQPFSRVSQLKI